MMNFTEKYNGVAGFDWFVLRTVKARSYLNIMIKMVAVRPKFKLELLSRLKLIGGMVKAPTRAQVGRLMLDVLLRVWNPAPAKQTRLLGVGTSHHHNTNSPCP